MVARRVHSVVNERRVAQELCATHTHTQIYMADRKIVIIRYALLRILLCSYAHASTSHVRVCMRFFWSGRRRIESRCRIEQQPRMLRIRRICEGELNCTMIHRRVRVCVCVQCAHVVSFLVAAAHTPIFADRSHALRHRAPSQPSRSLALSRIRALWWRNRTRSDIRGVCARAGVCVRLHNNDRVRACCRKKGHKAAAACAHCECCM